MEKIIIPLSRGKLLGLVLFATAVVFGNGYVLSSWLAGRLQQDLLIIALFCPIALLYFFPAWLCLVAKLFDTTPGLVIDRHGIFHNSAAASVGMIPWHEISNLSIAKTSYKGFVQRFYKR